MTGMDSEGTRPDAEAFPGAGGGRTEGPPVSVGGEQEPGGLVPPYEGRQESGDVDEGGAERDGAYVGGATGPRVSERVPDEDAGPGGRTASPADDGGGGADTAGYPPDPGTGPAHQAGVRRGEDTPE